MKLGYRMPICLGLYQYPTYDHRKANANLQGLTVATSHKQRKINMDVRCQSVWAYSNLHSMVLGIQMPTCRDLQLYPHIQTNKATCDHRKANANLQGLTIASSHTIKCIKQR